MCIYTCFMKSLPFPDLEQRMRVRTECTGANLRRATRAVSRVYDETLAVEEPECMHRGDPACRVVVRFP